MSIRIILFVFYNQSINKQTSMALRDQHWEGIDEVQPTQPHFMAFFQPRSGQKYTLLVHLLWKCGLD